MGRGLAQSIAFSNIAGPARLMKLAARSMRYGLYFVYALVRHFCERAYGFDGSGHELAHVLSRT